VAGVPANPYRVWPEFLQICKEWPELLQNCTTNERVWVELLLIGTTNERVRPEFLQIYTECVARVPTEILYNK